MRYHHGTTSLGDLFHVPEDHEHPNYPLREAIATLKRGLESEIQEVLSEEFQRNRTQHGNNMPKKLEKRFWKERAVLRSTIEKKPVDKLEKAVWVEKQPTTEQQRPILSDAEESAVPRSPIDDTNFFARERSREDDWELVEVEDDGESLSVESIQSTSD